MARDYPTGIKVYIDDQDVTKSVFGEDTITLTDLQNAWHDIDITPYVRYHGRHNLRITADAGVGRVEARVVIK